MDQELDARLRAQDEKLEQIYASAEKMRKYFLLSLIVSVVFFVLPLVGLLFAIPFFLNILSSTAGLI